MRVNAGFSPRCQPMLFMALISTPMVAPLARHRLRLKVAPIVAAEGKSVAHCAPLHALATIEFVSTSHSCCGTPRRGTPGSIVSQESAKLHAQRLAEVDTRVVKRRRVQ